MASLLSFDTNISYYTIPLALQLALGGRLYSGIFGPGKKLFDRQRPRNFPNIIKESNRIDEKLRDRLLRAEGCTANGFEVLPVYAAAVTAGNSAGVSAATMNLLSIGWVLSRLLYTYVYIVYQANEKLVHGQVPLRFKVWCVGATICMTMFVLAGMNMSSV